jgi:hypothetical protein
VSRNIEAAILPQPLVPQIDACRENVVRAGQDDNIDVRVARQSTGLSFQRINHSRIKRIRLPAAVKPHRSDPRLYGCRDSVHFLDSLAGGVS